MIKNTHVLAALSLALLIGLWGCSNEDSTLSPAEDLTVKSVGVEKMLSKRKGDPVKLIIESKSGILHFIFDATIFADGIDDGNLNTLIEGDLMVHVPEEFPVIAAVRGRLRIDKTKSGLFRVQLNVKGWKKSGVSVQLQFKGRGGPEKEIFVFSGILKIIIDGTMFEDITHSVGFG